MARAYGDPLRKIDDRLDRWRRWESQGTYYGERSSNALDLMQREAAEVQRRSKRVENGEELIRIVRKVGRLKALRLRDKHRDTGDDRYLTMAVKIEQAIAEQPYKTDTLPWASLIHGEGMRREDPHPEEEATDRAIRELPRDFRRVIRLAYLSDLPPEQKAQALGLGSDRGFYHRLRLAKFALLRVLDR